MEEITFLFCKLLNLLDFLGCRSRSEGTQGFKLTTCIFGIINNSLISRNKNECLCFYCNLSLYLDFNTHILRLCVRFWARRSRQASPTPPPSSPFPPPPKVKSASRPMHVSKPNYKNHNRKSEAKLYVCDRSCVNCNFSTSK